MASIAGVEAGGGLLDKGFLDGLRVGDRGTVFYELTVAEQRRRIDLGTVEVTELDAVGAAVRPSDEFELRAGHLVEFRLDPDRLTPAAILAVARLHVGEEDFPEMVRRLVDQLVPPADRALEEGVRRVLDERQRQRAAQALAGMVEVPGGLYWIGVEPAAASYYNQQPRFRVDLEPFWIDRRPVDGAAFAGSAEEAGGSGPAAGVTWEEAAAHCRRHGRRLPTEPEWEVAVQQPGVESGGVFEWTASWYRAYPGNRYPEAEYGEVYRVIRGAIGEAGLDPHDRKFMAPGDRHQEVGFRCARAAAAEAR